MLWDGFASGTYTSWAYSLTSDSGFRAATITVGLSGGGTDVYTYIAMIEGSTGPVPITYLTQSPGWRSTLNKVYPNTLPSGATCAAAYRSGPWNLRENIWSTWAGATVQQPTDGEADTVWGVTTHAYWAAYSTGLALVVDATQVIHGTLTVDAMTAYPTDTVGATTPVAVVVGGGGGSVDLTPVVDAINSLAEKEVDWTANQGGSVWSVYSRVVVP